MLSLLLSKHAKLYFLTGAFLSIGLMTNFLSLNEIFLISLQGKPILGVNLQEEYKKMHLACPLQK